MASYVYQEVLTDHFKSQLVGVLNIKTYYQPTFASSQFVDFDCTQHSAGLDGQLYLVCSQFFFALAKLVLFSDSFEMTCL